MSGLAGGGRNTVIKRLVIDYGYMFLISDTTRPPKMRDGALEQNGVHYYFRSEEEMLRDIENGDFIEAELIHNQQVSGTSIRELERANQANKVAVKDFEFGGSNNVAMAKPDAFVIGLIPPSYDEWINRLRGREMLYKQEFINRATTAVKVLENMLAKPYFKILVNRDLDECVHSIHSIVEENGYTEQMRADGRRVAGEILSRVKEVLSHPETIPDVL
jgi:guanylate kinase